jgi:hypothetical protein
METLTATMTEGNAVLEEDVDDFNDTLLSNVLHCIYKEVFNKADNLIEDAQSPFELNTRHTVGVEEEEEEITKIPEKIIGWKAQG